MNITICPHTLQGRVRAIASKSVAHRVLICAALSGAPCSIACSTTSADIEATVQCLRALGAKITETVEGFEVVPLDPTQSTFAEPPALDVGESGSTLRFLLPVVGALGCGGSFVGAGRLAERPLSPLVEELEAHGCALSEQGHFPLSITGTLEAGTFRLPGNISSQYISGLLLAAPLMAGATTIRVAEPVESRPYITLTTDALAHFGVHVEEEQVDDAQGAATMFRIDSGAKLGACPALSVEGDWSGAAFWCVAAAIGGAPLTIEGLNLESPQGDRAILDAVARFGAQIERSGDAITIRPAPLRAAELDVGSCPDLVPPLAALAAAAQGTTHITHAERLRLKESDRLASVSECVNALGGHATITDDGLIIEGGRELHGGVVDAHNDHRIAMLAAILASICSGEVCIRGAECVAKSYPAFFDDYAALGGVVVRKEV